MSLDTYVTINISAETTTPTQAGFGVPMIMSYFDTSISTSLVLEYEKASDMITAGFSAYHPAYLGALTAFSQKPRPLKIYVGQQTNAAAKTVNLYPIAQNATDYIITVQSNEGQTIYQYTSDASGTIAEITAGIEAMIDNSAWQAGATYALGAHVSNDTSKIYRCTTAGTAAGSGGPTGTLTGIEDNTCVWAYVGPDQNISVTDNTTYATLASDSIADWFNIEVTRALLTQADVTADGGVATDIAAIRNVKDDWYSFDMTDKGIASLTAGAAVINAIKRLFIIASADDDQLDSTDVSNLAKNLYTAGYDRTAVMYHPNASTQLPEMAWAGTCLPTKPGSITWMYQNLTGVDYTSLTAGEKSALNAVNANMYIQENGQSFTQTGKVCSGEYIDVMRGIDWTHARMQERVFALFLRLPKVPYTDLGVASVVAEIQSVLDDGVGNGLFKSDPWPTVSAPLVSSISDANKGNRLLPDISFLAALAGAIHYTAVNGTVTL